MEKIKSFLKKEYNFSPRNIRQIEKGVMNSNFYFNSDKDAYLFKTYNFKKPEEVLFEVRILEHLQKSNFPSPTIISDNAQNALSEFSGKPALVYKYIDGAPLEDITPEILHDIGTLKGRMHTLLGTLVPPSEKRGWDYKDIKALVEKRGGLLIEARFPQAEALLSFLRRELNAVFIPEHILPRGITHQDVKPENIIVKDGNIAGLVDFDNAYAGVLLYDIVTPIIWTCFTEGALDEKLLNAYISGYEKERALTDEEKKYFHEAIAFRLLREAFIGPFVTLHRPELSKERSDQFLTLYRNIYE